MYGTNNQNQNLEDREDIVYGEEEKDYLAIDEDGDTKINMASPLVKSHI